MFIQLLEELGLNTSLFVDLGAVGGLCLVAGGLILSTSVFKGILAPLVRSKLLKENIAILDIGGIETPLVTYPRGANELTFEHKKNKYSWNIPNGIERMLPNTSRYILASTKIGAAFDQSSAHEASNIGASAEALDKIRHTLSPKAQANTIDDRAKQIADKQMANVNKTMLYAASVGIILIIVIFAYLAFTKAMEYKMCTMAGQAVASTGVTLPKLPPL